MKKILWLLLALIANASANVPVLIPLNKVHLEGELPEPYKTFSLDIEIDENGNVGEFVIHRGSDRVEVPQDIVGLLKNCLLFTLRAEHEILPGSKNDFLEFTMNFGEFYRVKRIIAGREEFKFGYDSITIVLSKDNDFTTSIRKLTDYGWTLSPQGEY